MNNEITLYNDSSSQMSVMALGTAINCNPKTTLIVSDKEAEILLKYGHVKKYEDIASNGSEKVENLTKEIEALKSEIVILKAENEDLKKKLGEENTSSDADSSPLDRDFLKARAKELKIEFPDNIKTGKLAKLIEIKEKEGK